VNVITGTIKANFPARIAYQVASKVDSRTILDGGGADELIGKGDMLVNAAFGLVRVQNAFVSTEEVERITDHIANQTQYSQPFLLPRVTEEEEADGEGLLEDLDDLFKDAAQVVLIHQQGSVSLLQRKLKVGYNRAGRLIDQLFRAGVVGPYQGSAARDVLVASEEELSDLLNELGVE
jgi:S-DNA-T family DNA segregation ATPase FtsK/SpoIIIE